MPSTIVRMTTSTVTAKAGNALGSYPGGGFAARVLVDMTFTLPRSSSHVNHNLGARSVIPVRRHELAPKALDRFVPDFDVNEVHGVELRASPELALERVLELPAGSDRIVRALFRLRGLRRYDLPMKRFAAEVLGLETVEHTGTRFVVAGRMRGVRIGLSFEAEALPGGGSLLVTETRAAGGVTFRLYWLVIRPFSGLVRRRWLRAVERRDSRHEARVNARVM